MRLRRVRIPFFRIWYSSTYSFVFLCTLILLAATPADLIYQAIRNKQIPQVFAVGGVSLLTFIVTVLVYATRIYTNRTVLASIPKSYLPIEDGEVGRGVRKLIVREWHRSALIAWDARPRDTTDEVPHDAMPARADHIHEKARRRSHITNATVIEVSNTQPPWGQVSHAGWSKPSSADIPGLQYWSVIVELPNLIEAKAVSLAPPDPAFDSLPQYASGITPIPDERVVALLRRPSGTGIREYMAKLAQLSLFNPPSLAVQFLRQYEYARFSSSSLSETQFRDLMDVFGELLAGMTGIDPAIIEEMLQADEDSSSEGLSTFTSHESTGDVGSVRRHRAIRASADRETLGANQRGTQEIDFASGDSETSESIRSEQSVIRQPAASPG